MAKKTATSEKEDTKKTTKKAAGKETEDIRDRSEAEKKKALDSVLKTLDKAYGKNCVMRLGDQPVTLTPVLPTGILELDTALGIGGVPRGRITEIYGPESSGKTTVALHVIAETQKNGGLCAFIDAEHALDVVYAKALGVDTENLYVSQPDSGEEALDIAEGLARSGALDLIVVDSVAALVPRAEIEGQMGDSVVGSQARLMSKAMRKLAPILNKTDTAIIFINQLRLKVGIVYGNPEVTSGGNALKYYASIRLDVRRGTAIKKGENVLGHVAKIKVSKNKLAPPFKVVEADMLFGKGVDKLSSLLNTAIKMEVLTKSGTWFYFGQTRLGQGKDKANEYIQTHPDVMEEIQKLVYEKLKKEKEAILDAQIAGDASGAEEQMPAAQGTSDAIPEEARTDTESTDSDDESFVEEIDDELFEMPPESEPDMGPEDEW